MKPDVSSPYHAETLPVVKLISPKTSNKKKTKRQKSKKSLLLNRSHSRRDCKACADLHKMGIKGSNHHPMPSEKQEQAKLQLYAKQYQANVIAGKVIQAEQSIRKMKANHPILSRLTISSVQYLIKNSQVLFKAGANEPIYRASQPVERSVYILLYGHCVMKLRANKNASSDDEIGPPMGLGYVFNEEALFITSESAL